MLSSMQTLQNKALRIVYSKKEWPGTEAAHSNCKLLTISKRRELYLLKYAHTRSYDPENLKPQPTRNLRSMRKTMLKTQIPKNRNYERSFVHQSPTMWNKLDQEIKTIRNYKLFVTRVKLELIQNNLNFPE